MSQKQLASLPIKNWLSIKKIENHSIILQHRNNAADQSVTAKMYSEFLWTYNVNFNIKVWKA